DGIVASSKAPTQRPKLAHLGPPAMSAFPNASALSSAPTCRAFEPRGLALRPCFSPRFGQASVLELIDSWSIEVDGRPNKHRWSAMRARSDGFRRLRGDRVGPQLP